MLHTGAEPQDEYKTEAGTEKLKPPVVRTAERLPLAVVQPPTVVAMVSVPVRSSGDVEDAAVEMVAVADAAPPPIVREAATARSGAAAMVPEPVMRAVQLEVVGASSGDEMLMLRSVSAAGPMESPAADRVAAQPEPQEKASAAAPAALCDAEKETLAVMAAEASAHEGAFEV
jgi:hypothetical protein